MPGELERIREAIARIIGEDYYDDRDWVEYSNEAKQIFYRLVDKILKIKGLRVEADNQELPRWLLEDIGSEMETATYRVAQQDMLKSNFRKVIE